MYLINFTKARPFVSKHRKILPFEEDFDSEYDYSSEEYSYLSLEDIQNAISHKDIESMETVEHSTSSFGIELVLDSIKPNLFEKSVTPKGQLTNESRL